MTIDLGGERAIMMRRRLRPGFDQRMKRARAVERGGARLDAGGRPEVAIGGAHLPQQRSLLHEFASMTYQLLTDMMRRTEIVPRITMSPPCHSAARL